MIEHRLLDMLLKDPAMHPVRRGLAPRWLAPRPDAEHPTRLYREPNLSWTLPDSSLPPVDGLDETIELDVTGAFLAPLSSVELGFHDLTPAGRRPFANIAGYWKIGPYPWSDWRLGSPLGKLASPAGGWYTTPTVELLVKLARATRDGGPDVEILDSYLALDPATGAPSQWRPRTWAKTLGTTRQELALARLSARVGGDPELIDHASREYDAFKVAYSQAIQLLRGPKVGAQAKAAVRRPDWYDTIRAAHKARTWWKAWSLAVADHPVLAMDNTDTITIRMDTYRTLLDLQARGLRPQGAPRLDPDGLELGSMKPTDDDQEQTSAQPE